MDFAVYLLYKLPQVFKFYAVKDTESEVKYVHLCGYMCF